MKEAVSDFFRTTRFGLDIMKYLYRNRRSVNPKVPPAGG